MEQHPSEGNCHPPLRQMDAAPLAIGTSSDETMNSSGGIHHRIDEFSDLFSPVFTAFCHNHEAFVAL